MKVVRLLGGKGTRIGKDLKRLPMVLIRKLWGFLTG